MQAIHEKFMHRCIQLAKNGTGTTYPNPLVGSVIVLNDTIIGEGWHYQSGKPHAEVNAIQSVKDQSLLKEATIYVSLEPCSHYGKTPPCSDLIISKGIQNVVIGTVDPFSKVSGKGIEKLKQAGCEVQVDILKKECIELNKRFFTYHLKKRPLIIIKWAQTLDGYLAPLDQKERKPFWITAPETKQLVHKWRAEEQAILIGTTTAIKDNPKLNVRDWKGRNPSRVIIDLEQKIDKNSYIFDQTQPTLIFTRKPPKLKTNQNLNFISIENTEDLATSICHHLYNLNIQSLIVEGGHKVLEQFIKADLWDEARILTGNKKLGKGLKAPDFNHKNFSSHHIGVDLIHIHKNDNYPTL